MNRKWLACFLAGAMLLAALGGCGTQQDTVSSELPDSSEISSSEISSQEEVSSAAPVSEGQEDWSTRYPLIGKKTVWIWIRASR